MIERERRATVEVVRLASPPLNLLGSEMIRALHDAARELRRDPPRAVVLFCSGAGADVREMTAFTPASGRDFITALHEACAAVREIPAPVIAAIDGPSIGAHLELAAACDMRIASDRSRFGMPEIKVGIPSVIDAWWLVAHCGLGEAARLVFEGEMIDAAEAHRIRLVQRVVRTGTLDAEALAWAERIARASPVALRAQKAVLLDWTATAYRVAAAASIERFAHTLEDGEFAEAMRAMLDKREPRF